MRVPIKESGVVNGEDSADEADEKSIKIAEERQKWQWIGRGIAESLRKVIPPAALTLALCPKLGFILCQRGAELWISGDRAALNTSSHWAPRGRYRHFPPLPCVTRVCVFLFFIISFSCGTIGPRIPAEYELYLIFSFRCSFSCCLSGFLSGFLSGLIPILAFLCEICIFSPYLCGFFQVLWSNWSWWTCVSCAKLVLLPLWGWFQPYANCQEGLIRLWFTCGLSNALQKWSSLSKHYANINFFKHMVLALVKANKNDRRQTSVTNRCAL